MVSIHKAIMKMDITKTKLEKLRAGKMFSRTIGRTPPAMQIKCRKGIESINYN